MSNTVPASSCDVPKIHKDNIRLQLNVTLIKHIKQQSGNQKVTVYSC